MPLDAEPVDNHFNRIKPSWHLTTAASANAACP